MSAYKLGQTVLYNMTAEEKEMNNNADVCPATIVAVWGESEEAAVNLKVHTDGEHDIWVPSATKGDEPRQFQLVD